MMTIIVSIIMNNYYLLIGILIASGSIIPWFWIELVAMMFWALQFPFHARQYRHHNLEKLIHILPFVIGKCITDTIKN